MKRFAAGFVLSLSMALVAFARIAYRTIENRDATPLEFRPLIANRVFACDICQEGVSIQQRSIHADHQRAVLPAGMAGGGGSAGGSGRSARHEHTVAGGADANEPGGVEPVDPAVLDPTGRLPPEAQRRGGAGELAVRPRGAAAGRGGSSTGATHGTTRRRRPA
jgi:hypothetical protein